MLRRVGPRHRDTGHIDRSERRRREHRRQRRVDPAREPDEDLREAVLRDVVADPRRQSAIDQRDLFRLIRAGAGCATRTALTHIRKQHRPRESRRARRKPSIRAIDVRVPIKDQLIIPTKLVDRRNDDSMPLRVGREDVAMALTLAHDVRAGRRAHQHARPRRHKLRDGIRCASIPRREARVLTLPQILADGKPNARPV